MTFRLHDNCLLHTSVIYKVNINKHGFLVSPPTGKYYVSKERKHFGETLASSFFNARHAIVVLKAL